MLQLVATATPAREGRTMHQRAADEERIARAIERAVRRGSFCTLSTVSPAGAPHVVGILYQGIGPHLFLATGLESRKARNIQQNPHVAICIPVRKFPLAPPFCVQMRGTAVLLSREDAEVASLLRAGALKRITAKGVLGEPDLCFVRVTPARRIDTFGIGARLVDLVRDPLHASRSATRTEWSFG